MSIFSHWRLMLEGLLLVALLVQTARYEFVEMAFEEFRLETEVAGRVAEEQAKARIAEGKAEKEKADAENLRTTNRLRADIARLRAERATGGFVPPAASSPASPDRACFDRTIVERAIRDLDEGVQRLVDEGSKAIVDLDTAKKWAAQEGP